MKLTQFLSKVIGSYLATSLMLKLTLCLLLILLIMDLILASIFFNFSSICDLKSMVKIVFPGMTFLELG